MKTETVKQSERREEKRTKHVRFLSRKTLNSTWTSAPLSLWYFGPLCFPTTESVSTRKGGEEVAAVGASAFLHRSCCAARAQPPRTTTDARRARPLAGVATPPSRCRRTLNRNPDLRSPRLPGTVPSQLAKFGDIQNMKV